ncbi:hypothetical protein CJ188_006125 [Actinomycetales bacterium UMB0918]|nr:hypothetical protein CJ188_05275 [Actinomyces sp. UMB0918]
MAFSDEWVIPVKTTARAFVVVMVTSVLTMSGVGAVSAIEAPESIASIPALETSDIDHDLVRSLFKQEMIANGKYGECLELQQDLRAIQQERGPKGAAAKAAIKAAIKAIRGIGKKAWNATINKLPVPNSVKKYLGYETVMKALNVATGFEGTIENMITNALTSIKVPSWAAGVAARAIVFALL